MTYSTHNWGPGSTPRVIKWLIVATCTLTLLSALLDPLFVKLLSMLGPQQFFSLSWYGLRHYYLWEPVSYLFIQDTITNGISFFFLISLFFNMYILWILGTTLIERIGEKFFLCLYFICGILAGLTAILVMPLFSEYTSLAGPTAAILGVFMCWTMCNPDSELRMFFLIPIPTKWLLAGIIGIICLISLSQLNFISLVYYLSAVFYGYLFGTIGLGLKSPFAFTEPLDEWLISLHERLFRKGPKQGKSSKIVDMQGTPIKDDDLFIDEMLTKISKYGEEALDAKERRRMQQISERKMKERR